MNISVIMPYIHHISTKKLLLLVSEYIGRATIYIGVDLDFKYKKETLNTLVVAMQLYKQWYNDHTCSSTIDIPVPASVFLVVILRTLAHVMHIYQQQYCKCISSYTVTCQKQHYQCISTNTLHLSVSAS